MMKKRISIPLLLIIFFVGFMLAIQYNSINHGQDERDTRDNWAIRNELAKQKNIQSRLHEEIRQMNHTLKQYEAEAESDPEQVLKSTVNQLKEQAGFLAVEGPGLVLEIKPSPESVAFGIPIETIPSDLLTRFINEINRFEKLQIEIDGKRFSTLSPIRDINGITTVNGLNVSNPPFMIKIITENLEEAHRLSSYIQSSSLRDDFYLDNLVIDIHEVSEQIQLSNWTKPLDTNYLKEREKGEG